MFGVGTSHVIKGVPAYLFAPPSRDLRGDNSEVTTNDHGTSIPPTPPIAADVTDEYENIRARQWPRWRQAAGVPKDLMEALVELSFKGGAVLYLHVIGQVTREPLTDLIFSQPAVTASFEPHGTVFINPRSIVRARVHHSLQNVQYPLGLWFLEADDI